MKPLPLFLPKNVTNKKKKKNREDTSELVVPAGIMQRPFFDNTYPSFMNYGGLGVEIAREIVHAFDDAGRMYDDTGNRTNWWSAGTWKKFNNSTKKCLIEYYSNQTVETSTGLTYVDGEFTFRENFADVVGLSRAFSAYQGNGDRWDDEIVKSMFAGLDSRQLFFVSFAQGACRKYNKQYLSTLLKTERQAPAQVRVNAAVSLSKEFADTFHCAAGSPMNYAKCW